MTALAARFIPTRRRVACWILRYGWLLWLLLALAVIATILALPRLELAFGFKGVMKPDHPSRIRLEAYEREFRLGDSLFVYLYRPSGFSATALRETSGLASDLRNLEGVNSVFSALDLLEPSILDERFKLVRILGDDTLASDSRTRDVLSRTPYSDRWIGLLYDSGHKVLTLVVRPSSDYEDPHRTVELIEAIKARVDRFASRTGTTYHMNGLFYLNGEMLVSTFRDQGFLMAIALTLLIACFWALFGSLVLAIATMAVLGVSVLLGFGMMVVLGVPMNGLSGNLPILTLVNGLEDVVHLLVYFFATRKRANPRRAAASAIHECIIPNFLTSLTTFGALIVTGATDMVLLQAFGYAICIGVVVEYVVAIVFLPLMLSYFPWRIEGCLFYRLQSGLQKRWIGPWGRLVTSPAHLVLWLAICAGLIAYSWNQKLSSNWHRYFVQRHAVSRSLEFLERHRFPVTTIDCTLPTGLTFEQLLSTPAVERDLEAVARALGEVPGVVRVDTWVDVKRFCDDRIRRARFEPQLADRWVAARREALYRQYLELGAFDEYFSAPSRKLRIVVSSNVEDSDGILALSARILERARAVKLEVLDGSKLVCAGRTAYWGEVMGYVASTFVTNLVYSTLFILVVFLVVTRSLTISLVAMVPNVMPVFVMFSVARLFGYPIHEGFCVIDSLAIGNSVNDTIHYLFHLQDLRRRGVGHREALTMAFSEVGCAMTISSLLVAIGCAASVGAEGIAVILFGSLMAAACVVAVAMDVFMHPAMLWFLRDRW